MVQCVDMIDFDGGFPIHDSVDTWGGRLRDGAPPIILESISKAVDNSDPNKERPMIVEIGVGEGAEETRELLLMFGEKAKLMAIDTSPSALSSLKGLRQSLRLDSDHLDVVHGNGWDLPRYLASEQYRNVAVLLAANSLGISAAGVSEERACELIKNFLDPLRSVLSNDGIVALTAGPTGLVIRFDSGNSRDVFFVRKGDWVEANFTLARSEGGFQSRFWLPWLRALQRMENVVVDDSLRPDVRNGLSSFNFLQGSFIRLDSFNHSTCKVGGLPR